MENDGKMITKFAHVVINLERRQNYIDLYTKNRVWKDDKVTVKTRS